VLKINNPESKMLGSVQDSVANEVEL